MTAAARPGFRLTPFQAILYGALTVAVLDIADAFIFYAFYGATPVRILQSIAVGVLGRDAAYQGGAATALLGGAFHCFISLSIVTVFYVAATKLPVLTRRPWMSGTIYGLLVYTTMYFVVLPLSRVGMPHYRHLGPPLDEILIHIFGVGIPAAFFVRAAGPGSASGS
ncbi:MAG TPA: hypothetical protein VJN62_12800 [Gemmatimonadales bacterium]|nr:hypothetical protein [Gemmatimonadales bacterium]